MGVRLSVAIGTFLCVLILGAAAGEEDPPAFRTDVSEYGDRWITGDTNGDGRVDYAAYLTEEGRKSREAVDFNGDGYMDDFYYYRNEVLVREEIDTNYDQQVDLWVYLHRGVYIEKYERDTNHDGTPDVTKDFRKDRADSRDDRDGSGSDRDGSGNDRDGSRDRSQ